MWLKSFYLTSTKSTDSKLFISNLYRNTNQTSHFKSCISRIILITVINPIIDSIIFIKRPFNTIRSIQRHLPQVFWWIDTFVPLSTPSVEQRSVHLCAGWPDRIEVTETLQGHSLLVQPWQWTIRSPLYPQHINCLFETRWPPWIWFRSSPSLPLLLISFFRFWHPFVRSWLW